MKGRNLFVRIVAIILCAVMILSVVTAALYAFAAEPSAVSSPATGSANMTWVIVAVVAAVAVIACCLVIPKAKK
jgi:hypothetical protein